MAQPKRKWEYENAVGDGKIKSKHTPNMQVVAEPAKA
jgi:hypothetical protein